MEPTRKVVYKDGDVARVIRGECFFEDEFIRVETDRGPVFIGKSSIIAIKPIDGD